MKKLLCAMLLVGFCSNAFALPVLQSIDTSTCGKATVKSSEGWFVINLNNIVSISGSKTVMDGYKLKFVTTNANLGAYDFKVEGTDPDAKLNAILSSICYK